MGIETAQRNLKMIAMFWQSMASGNGAQIQSPSPSYEPVRGEIYPVGEITQQYVREYIGQAPNHVTVVELNDLLLFLDDFTMQMEEEDRRRRLRIEGPLTGGTGEVLLDCEELASNGEPGLVGPCIDLRRWRARLDEYLMAVNVVPPDKSHERTPVLWSVTAPLFTGWFGGPTGLEVPLAPGGFAPGFNPELQHPPDIATPYILANQYGIQKAWEEQRRALFLKDLMRTGQIDNTLSELKKILIYTAIGTAGLIVVSNLVRR